MDTTQKTAAPKKNKVESYDIARSDETLHLATDLAKFIKDNKLSTTVQGKEFVNVEGWQYAGSRLGIVPIVEHVINVSTEHELKYQAKVQLFDLRSGHTVGAGFAVCSNKENGKKFYQEFAIMSMAQTRAIGKAYRNILAWIIRAAGYEPTPAEEMDYGNNTPTAAPVAPVAAAPVAQAVPPMKAVPAEQPLPAPKYASASQKEEIIRLLNHPMITRQEKTKMLLNINRLDEERATQAITKLKSEIANREGNPDPIRATPEQLAAEAQARQAAADDLYQTIERLHKDLPRKEYSRAMTMVTDDKIAVSKLIAKKAELEKMAAEPGSAAA